MHKHLIRLMQCISGDDNTILNQILELRERLKSNNPTLSDDIRKRSSNGDISGTLADDLERYIKQKRVEHYTLVLVTEGKFLSVPSPIFFNLQAIRNYINSIPSGSIRLFLAVSQHTAITEQQRQQLSSKFDAVLFFERENASDAMKQLENYVQNSITEIISDGKQVDVTHTPKKVVIDPMANVPAHLHPYISPINYHYYPLPSRDEDPHPEWWYPENEHKVENGVHLGGRQWVMAAASRRGISHGHHKTPRDDAFTLSCSKNGWNILAIADGAGSAKLSRVTANESTRIAVETIKRNTPPLLSTNPVDAKHAIEKAIRAAISEVYDFQEAFNRENSLDKRDTYCTFLMLVQQPLEDGTSLFGVFHVGDGYMIAASPTLNRSSQITAGDHGTVSNESFFVLSFSKQELLARVFAIDTPVPIEMFMLVTDGIEEDMKPSLEQSKKGVTVQQNFERFAFDLKNQHLIWPKTTEWGNLLDWWISYERKGSNDDRTIAVLTTSP